MDSSETSPRVSRLKSPVTYICITNGTYIYSNQADNSFSNKLLYKLYHYKLKHKHDLFVCDPSQHIRLCRDVTVSVTSAQFYVDFYPTLGSSHAKYALKYGTQVASNHMVGHGQNNFCLEAQTINRIFLWSFPLIKPI